MILSRPIRRQHDLRVVSSAFCLPISRLQRRNIHKVPKLVHGDTFKNEGVSGMLSPDGFDIAWTQYQGFMVSKLNNLTAGTPDENVLTKNLLLKYARQADRASLFNHASMAHNNHLFFSHLSPTSVPIPSSLATQIDASFSSLDSLRATFIATANAMFGPGFVWLVKRNNPASSSVGNLAILNTYLAGSPYPGAHFRQQPIDMATITTGIYANDTPQSYAAGLQAGRSINIGNQNAGTFGMASRNDKKLAPGGQDLEVLMCVCTWEHVWLRDWGIGGKGDFLKAWWERIDWEKVDEAMGSINVNTPRPRL